MAVQVDYRIAPSDQFSVYNPDTKANKTITYFTLLAKIRGDLNISGSTGGGDISGSGSVNYLSKFDGEKSITISQLYDDGTYVGIGNTSPAHKLDVNGGVYADYFQLDTSYSDGAIAGKFSWNPDRETVELGLDGTVSLILGQDVLWYVKNQSGAPIPKGRAVRASGALGASSRITVEPMVADGSVSSKYLLGITIEEIENGADGFVISQGKIRGIDTSGYTVAGTVLYCDPSNAGQLTETEPTAPDLKLPIAFSVDKKNNGTLAVRITAGTTIGEANDVQLTSIANDQFLRYNSTIGAWENQTISVGTVTSVDITAGAKLSATGGPITTSGSITVAHIATEPADLPTMTSFISYVETNGGTVEAVGPVGQLLAELTGATVPTSTSNTGGTVLQNISIDDYGHVFGVSSVSLDTDDITEATNLYYTDARARAALSAGSGISYDSGTGTISNSDKGSSQDIFKTIAVSGQTDIVADSNSDTLTFVAGTNITITTDAANDTITINSPDAGGTVTSIGTSAPIQGGPITTSGTISITQSGLSTDGYLSSTDWNTFNNKEPALTKGDLTETTSSVLTIGSGTGAVIGSGTTITVSQSGISTSGYLSSTDWNTFNGKEPALTKGNLTEATSAILTITGGTNAVIGSGTSIQVSQATTTTSGYLSSTDWNTFNDKEPAVTKGNLTEATSSVLTITGGTNAVIGSGTTIAVAQAGSTTSGYLSSTDWGTFDGKADYSFVTIAVSGQTDVVADSASDTLTLVAGTGVTITTDAVGDSVTIAATGSGGTVTSIATSAPLSGGTITSTGTISITQSNASTDGYLSSTDWNTFNGKQDALTFTSPLVNTTGTVTINQSGAASDGYLSSIDWNAFNGKASLAFKTISVSGQSDIVADTADDTLTFVAGSGVTITTDALTDALTINATGTGGTVTSIDLTAGAKIAVSGGPITSSGSITVAHTTTDPADLPTMTSFISYVNTNGGNVEAVGPVGQLLAVLTGATVTTSTSNTGGTVLQNMAIDDYGHVFGISSVTLDTDDITEGSTNLYYTDARARAALSAGTGISYDSGTGVITNDADAFKTISVSGQSDIVADAIDDTLTVAQGDRIEITTDASTDTLTITHGLGDGVDLATAQAFEARVVADGGTFEAVWPIAVAIGALSGGTPANTSSNNTDGTVLQNIALDEFGHVLGYGSTDLDDRYYTETEVDALFALETLDTVTDRGATTTNSITIGGLTVDTSTLVVDSANNRVVIGGTSASYPLHVKTQVSNVSIYADYDIAAYSDARVKEDVITISGALEKVRSMRGVTYKRIGLESDKRFMGVIAQEVLPHAPEVVHQDEDGMYSVSYQNMVGLLIEAMKEQQQQIDELKEQLNKYLK
jgi:hypothetical protein